MVTRKTLKRDYDLGSIEDYFDLIIQVKESNEPGSKALYENLSDKQKEQFILYVEEYFSDPDAYEVRQFKQWST
jgi:hypothetical protein